MWQNWNNSSYFAAFLLPFPWKPSSFICCSLTLKASSVVSGVARALPASSTDHNSCLVAQTTLSATLKPKQSSSTFYLVFYQLWPPLSVSSGSCGKSTVLETTNWSCSKANILVAHVFTISKRLGNLKCAFGVGTEDERFTHCKSQVFQLNVTFVCQQCPSRLPSCPWRWVMFRRMRTATSW